MSLFSETYPEAREKFLSAARQIGAEVISHHHTNARGPSGEDLFMDIAIIGNPAAEKAVLIGSGTHGIEGYSGSAVQTNWMRESHPDLLSSDVKVILRHAHNPWGFAHASRFTEEGVDLNRNFVDFERALPENPHYPALQEIIGHKDWTEAELDRVFAGLDRIRENLGEQAYSDTFNGGQYTHVDGVFYGGQRAQWSRLRFEAMLRDHLCSCRAATMIDLHTGIGPGDSHVFLCFHEKGSAAYERARLWWSERAVNHHGVTHKAVARYQGLLVDAFVAQLDGVETTAVVVEFGTLPRTQMQRASLAARWLCANPDCDDALKHRLRQDIREAYYPSAPAWRDGVIHQSRAILAQAISGMTAFDLSK